MNIKQYKAKPIIIEAVQITNENLNEVCDWCNGSFVYGSNAIELCIHTLEGKVTASIGDYIVKGVVGEFYPCRGDIFESKYVEVFKLNDSDSFLTEDYNLYTKPYRG